LKNTFPHSSLLETVNYAFANSPFYQKHLKSFQNRLRNFNLEDFRSLPFTTKEDIAKENLAFCCVNKNKVAEYVTTSGTQGKPITIYLTKEDLERLAENERASLTLMGGSENDLYQLMTTIDKQFMAGLAYHSGILKMNAGVIRLGPGAISEQWNSILTYKPTKLIVVPSYISRLIAYAEQNNIDFQNCSIDSIICIGEPIRNNDFSLNVIGKSINDKWDVQLYSTYASTEMATAFSECTHGVGGHFNEDLIHCEVLNEKDEQVKNGESGEVVVTTLKVKGTPLIRYRTGDVATFWSDTCKCGNPSNRLGPILGRKNQLIKFKGTTVYPQTIINAIKAIDFGLIFQIEVFQNEITTENIVIKLAKEQTESMDMDLLVEHFQSLLKVKPELSILEKSELEKLIYLKDKRKPQFINYITK
jgi:phenylacetate-CoA ligase